MRIRFNDTGEEYEITGERPQFWLFRFHDGRRGKAVKGGHSYKLIDKEDEEMVLDTHFGLPHVDEEIQIREELSDFEESSNEES